MSTEKFSETPAITSQALIELLERILTFSLPTGHHLVLRGTLLVNAYSVYTEDDYRVAKGIELVFVRDDFIVDNITARNLPVQPFQLDDKSAFDDAFDKAVNSLVAHTADHQRLSLDHHDNQTDNLECIKSNKDFYIPLHLVTVETSENSYFKSSKIIFPVHKQNGLSWDLVDTISVEVASGDLIVGPLFEIGLNKGESSCLLSIGEPSTRTVVAPSPHMLVAWKLYNVSQDEYTPSETVTRLLDVYDLDGLVPVPDQTYNAETVDLDILLFEDHFNLVFASRNKNFKDLINRNFFNHQVIDNHRVQWRQILTKRGRGFHNTIVNIKIQIYDDREMPGLYSEVPVHENSICCSVQ